MEIICVCPTTQQRFTVMTTAAQLEPVGDERFVWVRCPYCDIERRTIADADYNPYDAQWHCQQVLREKERA